MKPTRLPNCSVQLRYERFCDAPTAEDMPFPICARHALILFKHMREHVQSVTSDPSAMAVIIRAEQVDAARDEIARLDRGKAVVYYAKIGALIKIGHTRDLSHRVGQLGHGTVVLATEPGEFNTELARLAEFKEFLASGREWFHPHPTLMAHIARLAGLRKTG